MRNTATILVTAWMYFTRIPLPARWARLNSGAQQSLEQSVSLLSLFGVLVGGVAALVFWGADMLFADRALAVLLSMTSTILLTGAMHEDGLSDFFDAFGGGWWSKTRILEIMKDSRVGNFGALALVFGLLIKYQSLLALKPTLVPVTLIAAHAFSRFAAASFFFTDQYVQANDQSHFKPMAKGKMHPRDFCVLVFFGVLPIALLGDLRYWLLVPFLWLARLWFGRWFVRKLDGYTGDCLGATQQVVELCFYLGVVVISRWIA